MPAPTIPSEAAVIELAGTVGLGFGGFGGGVVGPFEGDGACVGAGDGVAERVGEPATTVEAGGADVWE